MLDSLVYSSIQLVHNLGAALALGTPVTWMLYSPSPERSRQALWLLIVVWTLQGVSGIGFGTASWLIYGQLPDLHAIALSALFVKIGCVITAWLYCFHRLRRNRPPGRFAWPLLSFVAATALTAAAVLRWYS